MLAELKRRVIAPISRPFDGVRSLLAGLPVGEVRHFVGAPGELKSLAQLQLSFFNFRYVLPVLLARRLGLFGALEQAPLRLEQLALGCQVHPEAMHTLTRVLESQGIVTLEDDQVAMSEFASRFLNPSHPANLLPVVDLLLTYTLSFGQVVDSVRSGHTPAMLDVRADDETTDAILDAVNTHLAQASREFFQKADLPRIRDFIVGSMGVSFSAELLRQEGCSRVTYGCLEHLVRRIPHLRERYRVDPCRVAGMHAHSGEPAADRWGTEAFDLVFLTRKMILDPEKQVGQKFARKALDVLNPGGVAVFWEAVHPERGPSPLPLALETFFDLGMSPSAPLKTQRSFERMLVHLGYERVEYVSCLGGSTTFAVATKPD